MSKEIEAKVNKEELSSEHITFTPYGVEFAEERPTIEEWHKAVLKVQNVHGMLQFYLGDLMVFANSEVTGWGESKYDALINNTGYDYQTLANFASVARRFPASFRKDVLENVSPRGETFVTFGHFKIVQGLPDEHAKYFLEMVRDGRWTVSKLREEIARYRNNGQLPEPKEDEEVSIGYETFNNYKKSFFKDFSPSLVDRAYDERTWLLEIKETVEIRLRDLGVVDV